MKFLKITNLGTVPRKFLELLGFTTKRDKLKDLSIIGSKGSGTKLCIPASLRLGLKLWFCSSDDQGSYVLGYNVKKVPVCEGQEVSQIFFSYGEDEQIPMQFVLESFADWDKPIGADMVKEFKIVRELISNAQDADTGFVVEIVFEEGDGYCHKESGETSVFLTLTPGVEEIVRIHPERYIKFMSKDEPVYFADAKGAAYPKSSAETRVFLQGILVECMAGSEASSLYDYSLLDKSLLSEERTVKNHTDLYRRIGALIYAIDDLEFVKQVIEGIPEGRADLESRALGLTGDIPKPAQARFAAAWKEMHGEKAVIASDQAVLNEHARLYGYEAVPVISSPLRSILIRSEVKRVEDVATNDASKTHEIKLTPDEQAVFDSAYAVFTHFRPEARTLPVKFFRSEDKRLHWDGFAGRGDTIYAEIWISNVAIRRGLRAVLETLIHEWRHCFTRAGDCTVPFELQADRDEADLMFRLGPPDLLSKIKSR